MKTYIALLCGLLAHCASVSAQEEQEVNLNEVTVTAARVVNRPDGSLIIPSAEQLQSATNAYSLLHLLALPSLRVDPVLHSVAALSGEGTVQIRINGIPVSRDELLSLDPKSIKNVHFIDNPSVRYGQDVAYVIDIATHRAVSGYVVGFDGVNALTTWRGDNMAYAKWNHRNSELSASFDHAYHDFRGARQTEEATALWVDGTTTHLLRQDQSARDRDFSSNFELKYSLADSTKYVFQAKLSTDFSHSPNADRKYNFIDEMGSFDASHTARETLRQPAIDLYFCSQLPKEQTITLNAVGTSIRSATQNHTNERTNYAYAVDGRSHSLQTEAIYENRFQPLTLSLGVQTAWKYTDNRYSGDVLSHNQMHSSSLYSFANVQGNVGRLSFTAGTGVQLLRYTQAAHHYFYRLFRPKLTLQYRLSDSMRLRYSVAVEPHVSQYAMVSDTEIQLNSMEWKRGNADLKPNRRMEHDLQWSYNRPRFITQMTLHYRDHRHCNMARYDRTDDHRIVLTQQNQLGVRMAYAQSYTRIDLLPKRLSLSGTAGVYRFINHGTDYTHLQTAFNGSISLQAYLGQWTMSAYGDNGWRFTEDERRSRQASATYLAVSRQLGNCTLSLYWQCLFEKNPLSYKTTIDSRYFHKTAVMRQSDLGNMVSINVSWELSRGRRYKQIDRTMEHEDHETGIIK